MQRDTATIIVSVALVSVFAALVAPGASLYASLVSESHKTQSQVVDLEAKNRELSVVEQQLRQFRSVFSGKLANVTYHEAPDAFTRVTVKLGQVHRVSFGQQMIEGPLARPTPLPLDPALYGGPTPPPTPPPQIGAAVPGSLPATPLPVPSGAAVGFAVARDTHTDPWSLPLYTYAGTIDIVGSYPGVIAALQDLSRYGAFVRVMRATLCRGDNDRSGDRTLTVAYRLYGLPTPAPSPPAAAVSTSMQTPLLKGGSKT